MHPILFRLFGLEIYAYGASLALAFTIAIALASRDARQRGFRPEIIVDIALALCLGGLIGARLLYVLLDLGYYLRMPWEILNVRSGGLSFYGGAIGGIAAAWLHGLRKNWPNWVLADICAPYAPLAYAVVRIGCLLNGCCYGTPSRIPWALACKEGDPFVLRHPTQLYASAGSLAIFFLLYRQRNHKRFPGFLLFLYGALYAVMRGIIEIFRDDPSLISVFPPPIRARLLGESSGLLRLLGRFLAQFRLTQAACLILLAFCLEEIVRRGRRYRRRASLEGYGGEEVGRGAGAPPTAP